jgi:hypothetical protein
MFYAEIALPIRHSQVRELFSNSNTPSEFAQQMAGVSRKQPWGASLCVFDYDDYLVVIGVGKSVPVTSHVFALLR